MNDLSKDSVAALEAGYAHVCKERDALRVALQSAANSFGVIAASDQRPGHALYMSKARVADKAAGMQEFCDRAAQVSMNTNTPRYFRTRYGSVVELLDGPDAGGWVKVRRLSDNAIREWNAADMIPWAADTDSVNVTAQSQAPI